MESVLVTDELQKELLPYRQIPTDFGNPGIKRLDKWFYKLNLDKAGIIVKDPIDCMNFIIEHMIYTTDEEGHNLPEHWLQSADDVYEWIFDKRRDDCDGAAVALGSILYSLENPDVRLALGYYGDPRYADITKIQMNHAYNLIQDGDIHYLLDAVGDSQKTHLDKISDHKEYITFISAAPDGRIWIHGPWIKEYC